MKTFQQTWLRCALILWAALVAACTSPGYNDNPSQQITSSRLGCPAATDFFAVYFNVHLKPMDGDQASSVSRELFRSYCNHIPSPGRVFFTVDLVGSELKKTPIGIRIVERDGVGDQDGVRTLSEFPARTYDNGFIDAQFELDRNGDYAVLLTRSREGPASAGDTLSIPLTVGVPAGAELLLTGSIVFVCIALGLAIIGFAVSRRSRKRKTD